MEPLPHVCARVQATQTSVILLCCRKWMAEELYSEGTNEVGAGMQDTPELAAHSLGSEQSHFVQQHLWPRI